MKLTSLEKEVAESRQILHSATQEVNNIFKKKYFPESETASPVDHNQPPIKSDQKNKTREEKHHIHSDQGPIPDDMDPEVKKAFRRIATKVHPDKLPEDISEAEKQKKVEMFQQALRASEQNDFVTLAHIAIDIGVELPDIPQEAIKKTEERISSLKKEIKKIESTYVWQWYFSSDPEKKQQILNSLLELMYEKATKNSRS